MYAERISKGLPTPWWDKRPEIPDSAAWFRAAYSALTTTRPVGMSVGPIPWTAVDRYAERYGIEGDAFERLTVWVRMMDQAARADD